MPDEPKKVDEGKPVPLADQPEFKQMMSVMSELGKTVQQLTAGQKLTQEAMTKLATEGIKAVPPKKDVPEPDEDQVNEMSQAELAAHIFSGQRKMMDTLGKELSGKIADLTTKTSGNQLTSELRDFGREHTDLTEWLPEIKEALSEGRFVNILDAYNAVKLANPEKVKEVDTKLADENDDGKNGKDKTTQVFGGLTPTSGGVVDAEGKDVQLTRKEAQDLAWEENFGDRPELAGVDTD